MIDICEATHHNRLRSYIRLGVYSNGRLFYAIVLQLNRGGRAVRGRVLGGGRVSSNICNERLFHIIFCPSSETVLLSLTTRVETLLLLGKHRVLSRENFLSGSGLL